MANQLPLPISSSDPLFALWQQVASALEVGDTQQLQNALLDFISLSPTDKKFLEDLSTIIPYPGLPSQLITVIFANPEATLGVIERLGPQSSGAEFVDKLGVAERAIVMDALISWLQSEQKQAQEVKQDVKTETSQSANQNPLNSALAQYIENGGVLATGLNMGSLQFLKNNPITLSGLQIADPELLNKAYNVASGQLLLSLISRLDPSAVRSTDPLDGTKAPEYAFGPTQEQKLRDAIRKGIEDQAIPLNPQVFLVLWTLVSMPSTQGPQQIPPAQTIAGSPFATIAAGTLNQKKDSLPLPASPIIVTWLASVPQLFSGELGPKPSLALTEQLGLLSHVYTQMAPYWMGPGAVSLMLAAGGEVTEESKLDSSVRAFAIGLGALLNDKAFDLLITRLVKAAMPSVSQEQLKVFIAAMKISILMNALIALYITILRKTQGQFSAQELKDMILGKTPLPPDDLEAGLIKALQTELRNIPEEKHEAFLDNLLAGYNEFMDVEALVDPSKQFLNLCDPSFLLTLNRQSKG